MKVTLSSRLRTGLISLMMLVLSSALSVLPVAAAAVLFVPDGGTNTGSINAAIPMEKFGSITLPRGRVLIKGDTVQLSVIPEYQFDRHIVLSGNVLDTRMIGSAANEITGVVFFTAGEWIGYFDNPKELETVITDSQTISGRITAISKQAVEVNASGATLILPLSTVRAIRSPRAFTFSIPTISFEAANISQPFYSEARKVVLAPTVRSCKLTALRREVAAENKDGDVSTAKLVVLGTALSLMELGQLAPLLGVPLGNASALRRAAFFQQAPFLGSTSIP